MNFGNQYLLMIQTCRGQIHKSWFRSKMLAQVMLLRLVGPGLATLPDCFADAFVHDIGTAGVTGVWPYSFRTNLEAGDSSLIKCYPLVFFYVLEMAV